jgi:two-component system, OmpR family, sensor histidine kinase KdpD
LRLARRPVLLAEAVGVPRVDAPARDAIRTRGQLRIYFGAAPGVGKTHAMLAEAQRCRADGVDVVIGMLETHDFAELDALRDGLESIPPKLHFERNQVVQEIDVETAIRRRPRLILVDDLARRNPEGSRHFQRWQDVEELLDRDINVFTTLNVHDIESLNEVVRELTQIHFRETVPDTVFEGADEVALVDITTADLLDRLKAGKVHLPQPARMRRDMYRIDVLGSLRDLALRQASEQQETRRMASRRGRGAVEMWPASKKVLVCVDHAPGSEAVIRAGKRMAAFLHADWVVAYCESPRESRLALGERVLACQRLAEQLGAEVVTLGGYSIGQRLIEIARQKNVGRLVLERPSGAFWRQRYWRSIVRSLDRALPAVDVLQLAPDDSLSVTDSRPGRRGRIPVDPARDLRTRLLIPALWGIGVPAATTALSATLLRPLDPANHLLFYMLGVLFVASRFGFWPSAIAATLSSLASDFLLFPPFFSLAIARSQDAVTLGVFLLAALLASRLTDDLRFQSERASQREQRVRFLFEFTQSLASAQTLEEVAAIVSRIVLRDVNWICVLLGPNALGRVAPLATAPASPERPFDPQTAQWAFENRRPAGWGSDAMAADHDVFLPVMSPTHRYGVLALRPLRPTLSLLPEQRRVLDTVVAQIAQTLERIRLAREAHAANAQVETESLRNSLLSAIAHDFRTPLASIVAASSSLLQGRHQLSEDQARDLTSTILEEGQRMTKLANNTLEIARLESGTVRLQREWYPLDEIVGAVLSRMEDRLRGRQVDIQLPPGVPMAQVDLVMIVQVLENLIENAFKYTPEGSRIEVGAQEAPGEVQFWVADEGPGIPSGEDRRIFEKFYRGAGKETQSGVGLGLTICRIVVEAHGGRISVHNRVARGAEFRFTVPATEPAPRLQTEE